MRKLIVLALVVGCLGVLASVAMAAHEVGEGGRRLLRPLLSGVPKVTVNKGTKVKWRFGTGTPHTVTVKSGPAKFNSGVHELRQLLQEAHEARHLRHLLHDPRLQRSEDEARREVGCRR